MPLSNVAARTLRILVVDDDEVDRMMIRRALLAGLSDDHGAPTIVEVASGDSALVAILGEPPFSLVLLDYEMPGMNGIETVRAIRASGSGIPILVTTGREDEVLAELMAAGATDFLQKSDVTPHRMRRRVHHVLRFAQWEAQAEAARVALAREHDRTAAILDQLPIATLVANPDGTLVAVNRQAIALFGPHAAVAHTVDDLREPVIIEPDIRQLRMALRGEHPPPMDFTFTTEHGGTRQLRCVSMPFLLDDVVEGAVVVLDDVTEDRKVLEELARAVASRDEMLAIVSHDLRNPLHAVTLALDELASPDLNADLRSRYVAAIRRSMTRAEQLIRDLLDVSRIDAEGLILERRPMSVRDVLDGTIRDQSMLLQEAHMEPLITVDAEVAKLLVEIDPQRTGQALGNIVSNAIKYARGTTSIDLSARQVANHGVELIIADRGPGIAPENLPHVFDRFYQAETRRRAGAGLGLTIARGIARAHGGDLTAHIRDGGGAEFRYRLPLS